MGRKRYSPEQIITMLREAEVLQSGAQVAEVCLHQKEAGGAERGTGGAWRPDSPASR
jgi:hypothetical protein